MFISYTIRTPYGSINDSRRFSFCKTSNQSMSGSGRHSLIELRVICTIAGQWGKLTHQQHGLILTHQNQS